MHVYQSQMCQYEDRRAGIVLNIFPLENVGRRKKSPNGLRRIKLSERSARICFRFRNLLLFMQDYNFAYIGIYPLFKTLF